MHKNLYVSDLDGTLLSKSGTLSSYTKDTIQNILERNIPFTVASARSVFSIRSILDGLDISLPVICFNGAIICDFKTDNHYATNSIEGTLAESIKVLVKKHFFQEPFHSTIKDNKEVLYFPKTSNSSQEWFIKERTRNNDNRMTEYSKLTLDDNQTICLTYMGSKQEMIKLRTFIHENFEDIKSYIFVNEYEKEQESYWVSIYSSSSNKGVALGQLKSIVKLDDSKTTVFGDHLNDIPLFESADRKIAVSNAVSELKKLSCQIIGHHQEDSVATFLSTELL